MNENPNIIIRIPSPDRQRDYIKLSGVVRVSAEAELAILELCGKTGLSMRNVASQLIVQAAKLCTIVREESEPK